MADEPRMTAFIDEPTRVEHAFTPEGRFLLQIDFLDHQTAKPATVQVEITADHVFQLLAQLEATRQQFGLPLPAIFSQQQTRQ